MAGIFISPFIGDSDLMPPASSTLQQNINDALPIVFKITVGICFLFSAIAWVVSPSIDKNNPNSKDKQ